MGLVFPGSGPQGRVSPQAARPAVSEMKIGAAAGIGILWYPRDRENAACPAKLMDLGVSDGLIALVQQSPQHQGRQSVSQSWRGPPDPQADNFTHAALTPLNGHETGMQPLQIHGPVKSSLVSDLNCW